MNLHTWLTFSLVIMLTITAFGPTICADQEQSVAWEIRWDSNDKIRPPIVEGLVNVTIGDPQLHFPRYLNELGVKRIRISFRGTEFEQKKISVVWSGGSQGPDKFALKVDSVHIGESQTIDTGKRPYVWYLDEFPCRLAIGPEHTLEITSPAKFTSAIEFAGISLSSFNTEIYQPLCYESIGSLRQYEKELGGTGALVKSTHLWVFAPKEMAAEARELATFLEKAYSEMKRIYGMDTLFKFSVEHYPKGHRRGWGGISGAGTIGYTTDSLKRFAQLKTTDVRGFAGYTEEMSHGFKSYYACGGTYEALGVAIQEEVVRRLVSVEAADKFWIPEHRLWDETHQAYLGAGRKNPDSEKYPWNVLFTRILNSLFLKLRTEYGPNLWHDFFRTIQEMDFPLHTATDVDRMKVYAGIFSKLLKRDMAREFTEFGIDLEANPPWGWETYKK